MPGQILLIRHLHHAVVGSLGRAGHAQSRLAVRLSVACCGIDVLSQRVDRHGHDLLGSFGLRLERGSRAMKNSENLRYHSPGGTRRS